MTVKRTDLRRVPSTSMLPGDSPREGLAFSGCAAADASGAGVCASVVSEPSIAGELVEGPGLLSEVCGSDACDELSGVNRPSMLVGRMKECSLLRRRSSDRGRVTEEARRRGTGAVVDEGSVDEGRVEEVVCGWAWLVEADDVEAWGVSVVLTTPCTMTRVLGCVICRGCCCWFVGSASTRGV